MGQVCVFPSSPGPGCGLGWARTEHPSILAAGGGQCWPPLIQPLCPQGAPLYQPHLPGEMRYWPTQTKVTCQWPLLLGTCGSHSQRAHLRPGGRVSQITHLLPYLTREECRLFLLWGVGVCGLFFVCCCCLFVFKEDSILKKILQNIVCIYHPKLTTDNML